MCVRACVHEFCMHKDNSRNCWVDGGISANDVALRTMSAQSQKNTLEDEDERKKYDGKIEATKSGDGGEKKKTISV